jgi:galactokinase/mevalonate kinase-like predicted kinase
MPIQLTIPARINILGNPGDANEGDFATISAAIDVFAHASLAPASALILEMEGIRQEFAQPPSFPLPYDGQLDLMKAACNRLYHFSPELRSKMQLGGVHIRCWSHVPRQSGLGGSSLFVLLVLGGLRHFYDLDRRLHNDYLLGELAQRAEAIELGITCGFADRYVPLFGSLAYLDYRGKLHHHHLNDEPYVTYERLDNLVDGLPLVAITTGIQHNSGNVHGCMRPRYLEEQAAWEKTGGEPLPMLRLMRAAWETAWRGKIALLHGDLPTFGALMNTNHRLVDEMMHYCGFEDGAGWADNLFIQAALEHGALGAKLTGAGGGGSVFALTEPGQEDNLAQAWQRLAISHHLNNVFIFQPRICRQGLVITEE